MNRRTFVQLSTGALLSSASVRLASASESPAITNSEGIVRVQGPNYLWQYSLSDDRFTLLDSKHRPIVSGMHQPVIVVAPASQPNIRIASQGKPLPPKVEPGKVTISYEGVNDSAQVSVTWRFDQHGIWTDPITYDSPSAHEIVSLHYFANAPKTAEVPKPSPTLHPTFLVVPGIISGSTLSPILHSAANINNSFWLGRGSTMPGIQQQWALPVHFFCGFSTAQSGPERNLYTEHQSDTFCCGLAELPQGDLFLAIHQGDAGPWIDYRSDLWHHLTTPAVLSLGATLHWAIAPEYRDSIATYYLALMQAGFIRRKHFSARKAAVALTPQFCTWGAQRERDKVNDKLDEAFLTSLYQELKDSGMEAGLFSIDDKWEGAYGNLVHDQQRFPNFEQFLLTIRGDGKLIGMWAAIMRCEHPADLGLNLTHMLLGPDGKPFVAHGANNASYYILDFTQPEVVRTLTETIRRFMRRYRIDLFKFDFGYELPTVSAAAPKDKHWIGERLLWKGLEVVLNAMRAENPDIVVMYYNLSPLFLEFIDLHSPDDLWMDMGDYQIEANRRLFFSSLMGPLGVPTYGSSGYDWSSSPSIWFDSAATGTIGSLNDFMGDEQGESVTPDLIAKYNGITHVLRPTTVFEVLLLDSSPIGPTSGAHARSWVRIEDGQLTLLAWRPPIPGEENRIANARPADPRTVDAVRSNHPVIVASKNNESILRSSSLAIVSYGGGEISLARQSGERASVTSHYFRSTSSQSSVPISSGRLQIKVESQNANNAPLEWIEVLIS